MANPCQTWNSCGYRDKKVTIALIAARKGWSDVTVLETVVEIHAPVAAVWNVLTDSSYTPKLYPDILTSAVDPPGPSVVGQKTHLVGRGPRRPSE